MSIPVKYSTTSIENTIKTNNIVLGTKTMDYGPTSSTGFYVGIDPPASGYTIYQVFGEGQQPKAVCADSDDDVIYFARSFGGTDINTISEAIAFFVTGSTGTTIVNMDYPNIVTDGLILNLDAGFLPSYPRIGSTWYDISSYGNDAIISGTTHIKNNYFVFDSDNDRFYDTEINCGVSGYTLNWWIYPTGLTNWNQWIELGDETGSGHGWFVFATSSSGYIYAGTAATPAGGRIEYIVGGTVEPDVWQNFCFTYTGGIASLYKNSGLLQSRSMYASSSSGFTKVGSQYASDKAIKGRFSYFSMHNRALSENEIIQNYNALVSRFYGNELISNTDFNTDAGWSLSNGVTISGGTLNFTPTLPTYIHNTAGGTLSIGKTYYIVFTITEIIGGSGYIKCACGGWGLGTEYTTAGTKKQTLTPVNASGVFSFYGGLHVKIDNVTVKEMY